jgi:regulator of telomere elongation helicase 1
MPTTFIDGIPVEFPHSAYPCQITYMQSVLQALKRRENALLESPTGTGKTLSLLCAALAWRTAEMGRSQLRERTSSSATYDQIMERTEGGSKGGSSFRPVTSASGSVSRLQSVLDESLEYSRNAETDESVNDVFSRPPLIIYASRTHSQLTQVIRELRRTTYRPKIAIVGSREQMCIHPNVRELSSSSAQSAVCSRLVRKKACEFHARVPEALNHLKKRVGEKDEDEAASGCSSVESSSIMDMEDLIEFASLHK